MEKSVYTLFMSPCFCRWLKYLWFYCPYHMLYINISIDPSLQEKKLFHLTECVCRTYLRSTAPTSLFQVFVPDDRWKPGSCLELVNIACELTQMALCDYLIINDGQRETTGALFCGVTLTFVWVVELEDVGSGWVIWQHHHPSSHAHLLTEVGFILWQTQGYSGLHSRKTCQSLNHKNWNLAPSRFGKDPVLCYLNLHVSSQRPSVLSPHRKSVLIQTEWSKIWSTMTTATQQIKRVCWKLSSGNSSPICWHGRRKTE